MARTTKRRRRAGRKYEPTTADFKLVEAMASVGITHEQIAEVINVSLPTLYKYFQDILDTAAVKATTKVAASLYENATVKKNVTAQIFWMKTRGGWREKDPVADGTEPAPSEVIVVRGSKRPARLQKAEDDDEKKAGEG